MVLRGLDFKVTLDFSSQRIYLYGLFCAIALGCLYELLLFNYISRESRIKVNI
jgi:hypothetical protein